MVGYPLSWVGTPFFTMNAFEWGHLIEIVIYSWLEHSFILAGTPLFTMNGDTLF